MTMETNESKVAVLNKLPSLQVGDKIILSSGEYFLENIMQSVVDASEPPVIKFFLVLKLITPASNTEEN